MNTIFYITAGVAIICTAMAVSRLNAVHALLYLIVSLLSVALMFFLLGAPFAAAMEVIVYAGAIMVLFVFVMMMLNLGPQSIEMESTWLRPGMWVGPAVLTGFLLVELIVVLTKMDEVATRSQELGPSEVSTALFGPYFLGVELTSILLLAGLVGAYHIARRYAHE